MPILPIKLFKKLTEIVELSTIGFFIQSSEQATNLKELFGRVHFRSQIPSFLLSGGAFARESEGLWRQRKFNFFHWLAYQ